MARSVGVEIAHDRIRLLELEGAPGRPIHILRAVEVPIRPAEGESRDDAASRTLRETFVKNRIPADHVLISVDSGESLIREVTLPFTDEEQIRVTVKGEMENLIQNFTLEQLVIDWFVARKGEKESSVIVNAIPRDLLRARLGLCERAGVDPVAVDLDIWALSNALRQADQLSEDRTVLVLHGGIRFTKMVLFEGGRPRHIRSLRYGLPEITGETAEAGAAAGAARAAGEAGAAVGGEGGDDGEPLVLVGEAAEGEAPAPVDRAGYLTILYREISRFLLSSAGSGAPAQIMATGELLRAPDVLAVLEEKTGLPVGAADVLGDYQYDMTIDEEVWFQATYAVPLGLALKGVDRDYLGLDFRQDEFTYFKKFDLLKQSSAVFVGLIAIALAFVAVYYRNQARLFRDDAAQPLGWMVQDFKDIFPKEEVPDPDRILMAWQARIQEVGDLNPEDHPLPRSSLRLWKLLFDRFQEFHRQSAKTKGDKLYVQVTRLDVQQGFGNAIRLELVAGSIAQVDGLKEAIRKEPLFAQIKDMGPLRPRPDGRIDAKIQIELEVPK